MAVMRSGCIIITLLLMAALVIPGAIATADDPLSSSEISIRQSHLAWVSLTRETEMNAAITYIYPLYSTDTSRLTVLLGEFKKQEALIPSTTTQAGFDNITREMRAVTAQFRNESGIQMTTGYGKWDDLTLKVRAATTNNPYIGEKRAAYWSTRRTNQLKDFDAYVVESQVSLDNLKKQGYDTTAAQRSLDVIGSKRPAVVEALESHSEDSILTTNEGILTLTRQLEQEVVDAQGQVSDAKKMEFLIEQGYRAVARADRINNDLRMILLDIDPVESTTKKVKVDLAATKTMLGTGNLPVAKTPLSLVKKDLKDLSMAYRDIANAADLPPALTTTLRSMVITLDNTADQMEVGV